MNNLQDVEKCSNVLNLGLESNGQTNVYRVLTIKKKIDSKKSRRGA